MSHLSGYSKEQSTDCLVCVLVNVERKIDWIRLGKNTYYPQDNSFSAGNNYNHS